MINMISGRTIGGSPKAISVKSDGAVRVEIQDRYTETIDLYLYRLDAQPSLTAAVAVDDTTFQINSNANVTSGDAITLYEGSVVFQSIVVSSTETSVTISTPCDKVFSTNAIMHIGPWSMNVNGSVTPQIYHIHAAPSASIDIYTLTVSALDDLAMDSSTFLGIADGITNGFLLRQLNGSRKNLGLFVNNLGFDEFGFEVTYTEANKKSQYGLVAKKNIHIQNGVSVRLVGSRGDQLQAVVRDDLTSQTLLAVIVSGHTVAQ
jgi:hypothetical protein